MALNETVLFEGESDFGNYKVIDTVYDGRKARMLYGANRSPQSGIAQDDDPTLLFDYNQRLLEIATSTQPKTVLIIGGGACTLPKALLERLDRIRIDVVEIDPLLPEVAHTYFDVPRSPRLQIIIGDGREYISSCKKAYDMIILDAFSGYTIPTQLITQEAVLRYDTCLRSSGLMAVNFIAAPSAFKKTLAHYLSATFASVFPTTELYPAGEGFFFQPERNLILVASHQDYVPLDYLQAVPITLQCTPEDAVLHDDMDRSST